MKQSEFIELLAKKTEHTPQHHAEMLEHFWELVIKTLKKGDEVVFPYGKFVLKKKPKHEARNPMTGETIVVPAKVVPQFKAGKRFKDSVSA
ncbi:MAG: integration host factor subunit beta [Christensenellaceae bacterium]|jgi:DNA-binding protein HU-beta|nr:integration host factor subunit beta [Christensenellaceae bacterium]